MESQKRLSSESPFSILGLEHTGNNEMEGEIHSVIVTQSFNKHQ